MQPGEGANSTGGSATPLVLNGGPIWPDGATFTRLAAISSSIQAASFSNPSLVRIGNSVGLSDCTLIGHDGVVLLIEHRFGKHLDSVGFIDIKDNCFIGHGAIVMPRVTIGPESIVAAGAVVTKDVPPGTVYGGNPAVFICTTEQLIQRVEARCEAYPWIDLVKQRNGAYDPEVEPLLMAQRRQYFFGDGKNG